MNPAHRKFSLSSLSPDKLQTVRHGECFSLSASLYRQTNKHTLAQPAVSGNSESVREPMTN